MNRALNHAATRELDDLDRAIINRLQGGFPVCDRPYAEAAATIGTDETALIGRLGDLLADVERMGGAFSLCALAAPRDDYDRITTLVNAHPEVAHNYEREHALNMWFVLACASREDIPRVLAEIEAETGCTVYDFPREAEYFIELKLSA
jgi:DNA-binding Lrp family transcriptional regulator